MAWMGLFIKLADGGDIVTVLSIKPLNFKVEDEVLVAGGMIDKPAENIAGYKREDPPRGLAGCDGPHSCPRRRIRSEKRGNSIIESRCIIFRFEPIRRWASPTNIEIGISYWWPSPPYDFHFSLLPRPHQFFLPKDSVAAEEPNIQLARLLERIARQIQNQQAVARRPRIKRVEHGGGSDRGTVLFRSVDEPRRLVTEMIAMADDLPFQTARFGVPIGRMIEGLIERAEDAALGIGVEMEHRETQRFDPAPKSFLSAISRTSSDAFSWTRQGYLIDSTFSPAGVLSTETKFAAAGRSVRSVFGTSSPRRIPVLKNMNIKVAIWYFIRLPVFL